VLFLCLLLLLLLKVIFFLGKVRVELLEGYTLALIEVNLAVKVVKLVTRCVRDLKDFSNLR